MGRKKGKYIYAYFRRTKIRLALFPNVGKEPEKSLHTIYIILYIYIYNVPNDVMHNVFRLVCRLLVSNVYLCSKIFSFRKKLSFRWVFPIFGIASEQEGYIAFQTGALAGTMDTHKSLYHIFSLSFKQQSCFHNSLQNSLCEL